MGLFYEKLIRPALFQLDPEHAHELAVDALALLAVLPPLCRLLEAWNRLPQTAARPVEAFGLSFPNAVGLAAGFDKNARAWPAAGLLSPGRLRLTKAPFRAKRLQKHRKLRLPGGFQSSLTVLGKR